MNKNIMLADINSCQKLANIAKLCNCTTTPHKLTWSKELFEYFVTDKDCLVYVYCDPEPVGCVVARFSKQYDKLHLYNLFVLPQHRHHNIGKLLLQTTIDQAKMHGTRFVCSLNCNINKYLIKKNFVQGKIYLYQDIDPYNNKKHLN